MTRQEHLMTIGMEECNEIAQRISKAMRFGMQQVQPGHTLSNRLRIREEYIHLVAVLEMIDQQLVVVTPKEVAYKNVRVEAYLAVSSRCGTLDGEAPSNVCGDEHADGYVCLRVKGHGGRHRFEADGPSWE